MRITVLTHATMPFGLMLARAFADRGHPVEIVSMVPGPAEWRGVPIRPVGPEGFDPAHGGSRWTYLRLLGPVRRALAETRPDVVLALYLSSGGLVGCLTGQPHVAVSALGSDVMERLGSRPWRAVYRWMGRRAGLVHAVSQPLADALESMGVPARKIVVAPIGIDVGRIAFAPAESRPGTGRLLTTRAHAPVYDQATLLKALRRLQGRGIPVHATFASGRDADRTRDAAESLGVSGMATFTGGFRDEDLSGILAGHDVYVSCSLHDGTSNSLLEALASGLFPVVSDIPANRPWVEHGRTGLLFPPGDDAALADALDLALRSPDLRAAAAPLNRARVERDGDLVHQADRLLAAFEALLDRTSP